MKAVLIASTLVALVAAAPADILPIYTRITKPITRTTAKSTTTCSITLCADYINKCGMMYGGCYPACPGLPTPTFVPPPCPSTTKTTTAPCQTICVDAVNECGIKYGGCYCRTSPPPYTKPPCPSTKTTTAAPTPTGGPKYCGGLAGFQCDKGEVCIDDPKSPCGIAVDCLGICVTPKFCGGIAAFPCDPGYTCIDDPRDDCSPKTGGADCGGICIPSRWV